MWPHCRNTDDPWDTVQAVGSSGSSEGRGTEPGVQPSELDVAEAARLRGAPRRLDLCLAVSTSGRARGEHLASKGTAHSTPGTPTLVGRSGFGNVNCDRCRCRGQDHLVSQNPRSGAIRGTPSRRPRPRRPRPAPGSSCCFRGRTTPAGCPRPGPRVTGLTPRVLSARCEACWTDARGLDVPEGHTIAVSPQAQAASPNAGLLTLLLHRCRQQGLRARAPAQLTWCTSTHRCTWPGWSLT